jgi:hypothetical protein
VRYYLACGFKPVSLGPLGDEMNGSLRTRATSALIVVVLATILSVGGWWTLVSPWAFRHLHMSIIWGLNIIPASAGVLVGRRSPDHFLASTLKPCDFCGPIDHLANYLALAIPAYLAVFLIVAVAAHWVRMRRGSRPVA